eukprot:COSAG01_NODE_52921_length_343_cov_0.627049_2_plen_37_part_01
MVRRGRAEGGGGKGVGRGLRGGTCENEVAGRKKLLGG